MYRKELLQKLSASWVSCMVMMVEGNLLALNAKHCLIALKSSLGALILFIFTIFFIFFNQNTKCMWNVNSQCIVGM